MSSYIEKIYSNFRECPQVDALALGGSRSEGIVDDKSDYDLYVYINANIENESREKMFEPICEVVEIANKYWEPEDNIVLKDGVCVDIIYRNVETMGEFLKFVVDDAHPMNGYTTCFWHNVKNCEIIFDKTGDLTKLQNKYRCEYPQKLKEAIIERNMKLLSGVLPSYDKQIAKAFDRFDYVSINHRVAAYLESYFDVIFALNEMTHPGEKKLMNICRSECKLLPKNFEKNISSLFEYMFKYDVSDILDEMYKELKKLVDEHK